MAARPPPPPLRLTESPPDELIEEILVRLPPDEPSCLLRASLVCKLWRFIISQRRFRRRLHEHHGRPPVLGFLRNNHMDVEDFVATTPSAFSLAVPRDGRALDYRHGRALLLDMDPTGGELVLWNPFTGEHESVPVGATNWDDTLQGGLPTAAIVCAAAGCNHQGCRGIARPFKLVIVYTDNSSNQSSYEDGDELEWFTLASTYTSETDKWSDMSWIQDSALSFTTHTTSVLVGDSLLYFLSDQGIIIQYDLAEDSGTTILSPPWDFEGSNSVALILTEDGGLGVGQYLANSRLNIWSRDDALWVISRVIDLDNLLPAAPLGELWPMSFAGRANVLFIGRPDGIFAIEIQSKRVRKVCEVEESSSFVPIESFYIHMCEED